MRALLFALLILPLGSMANEEAPQQETILAYIGGKGTGWAYPDFRIQGHRVFPRHEGDGFLMTFYFTGNMFRGPAWYVMAFDGSGEQQWVRSYTRTNNKDWLETRADAVAQTPDGRIVAAIGGDLSVETLDSGGELIRRTPIYLAPPGGSGFDVADLRLGSDGSVAVLATRQAENDDLAIARVLYSEGTVAWERTIGGSGKEKASAMLELADGSLLVGAISSSPQGPEKTSPHFGNGDIWLLKYSKEGERLWDKSFGGDAAEELFAIRTNALGIVLFGVSRSGATGNKQSSNLGATDVWVVQLSHSGELLKESAYGTAPATEDYVSFDGLHDVFSLPGGKWVLYTSSSSQPPTGGPPNARGKWLFGLNADLSERWRLSVGEGAVGLTQSGYIRLLHSRDQLRQWIVNEEGAVIFDQPIPPLSGAHPSWAGKKVMSETPDGGLLLATGFGSSRFKAVVQPRGAPIFGIQNSSDNLYTQAIIASTFTNAAIFFTTNNTPPTAQSPRYVRPLNFRRSVRLHAIAFSSDFSASATNSIFLPGKLIETRTLTISAGEGGTVQLEGLLWNGSREVQTTELITNSAPITRRVLKGRDVRVTALPSQGASFIRWEGSPLSTNDTVELAGFNNEAATAVFGSALQTSSSQGGFLLANSIPATNLVPFGPVSLRAVPDEGFYFGNWQGGAAGLENPLYFTFSATNQPVSAQFLPLSDSQAAPVILPFGPGEITVIPRKNVYSLGEEVEVTATPHTGAAFLGWIGGTNTSAPTLSILARSQRLHAMFAGIHSNTFSAALPSSSSADLILTSTNLVHWTPIQAFTNFPNILLFSTPLEDQNRQFFRAGSAAD